MSTALFIIALSASAIGAICGIGGGVIIKPVLDMLGVASVSTISFLSSCTVLSMTLFNVGQSFVSKSNSIDVGTGTPLAVGAAAGGICGSMLFSMVQSIVGSNFAGALQSICLMFLLLGTLVYTLKKGIITTKNVTNPVLCGIIGLVLGLFSSFLGIGGGPFNLVVLHYYFSMETKKAVSNSLYIILFSQITNISVIVAGHKVPSFETATFILMILGGIGGGIIGRLINKKIDDRTVDKLFLCLLFVIAVICVNNTAKYLN